MIILAITRGKSQASLWDIWSFGNWLSCFGDSCNACIYGSGIPVDHNHISPALLVILYSPPLALIALSALTSLVWLFVVGSTLPSLFIHLNWNAFLADCVQPMNFSSLKKVSNSTHYWYLVYQRLNWNSRGRYFIPLLLLYTHFSSKTMASFLDFIYWTWDFETVPSRVEVKAWWW